VKELDFMIKNISDKVLLGSEITQLREKLVALNERYPGQKTYLLRNINLVQEIVTSVDKKLEVLTNWKQPKGVQCCLYQSE